MSKGYECIGKYQIFLEKEYYLCYAGGSRELPAKQQRDWNRTLHLPYELQLKEKRKLGLENNPNTVPLKGRDLLMFIRELKFVPLFDRSFHLTGLVKLTDINIYNAILTKTYGTST